MTVDIRIGDCRQLLAAMPDESVHCVVTSPPYFGLRDYGVAGQIGLEPTPDAFVAEIVAVFRGVRRVLRADGTCWLNLGDSYSTHAAGKVADPMRASTLAGKTKKTATEANRVAASLPNSIKKGGLPEKNLLGVPWRVAFALQADGWHLRQDIIWSKPNPMPESVTDRCTKAHEYLFLLSKSARYHFDAGSIAEPAVKAGLFLHSYGTGAKDRQDVSEINDRRTRIGLANWNQAQPETRNKRSVWEVTTQPFPEAHFATFPPDLIEPCIKAGCPKGGTVLDPFGGAGTTGLVADRLGRSAILLELNPTYAEMARRRITNDAGMFAEVAAQ